ncbi:MAG TPA: D-glycero-beta-D-manno-heptose 1-phosphate adenylyltransferase [Flavitalea sp.]|nr:D-glycero-beta-D-manno-heptose 1-phosphate adenylyltransferase [Flavitalea sp.]
MKKPEVLSQKILTLPELRKRVEQWKFLGKSIAFTNGCFDILHEGHIASLSAAAKEADMLIVGLNSDTSAKKLKGNGRPVNQQQSRAIVLASLLMVDAVIVFEEDTPLNLIVTIKPDVLVKGGDYREEQIAGANEVKAAGGRIVINPIVEGFSTSALVQKIQKL